MCHDVELFNGIQDYTSSLNKRDLLLRIYVLSLLVFAQDETRSMFGIEKMGLLYLVLHEFFMLTSLILVDIIDGDK